MSYRLIIGGAALAVVAVGASACNPVRHALHIGSARPMIVASTLDCPDQQGDLTRVSANPNGHDCVYRGKDGEEVNLSLLSLDGQSPQMALKPLEGQLQALSTAVVVKSDDARMPPTPPTPPTRPKPWTASTGHGHSDKADAKADHDGDEDSDNDADSKDQDDDHEVVQRHDHTKVDLPFVHVDADDTHDGHNHAKVDVPFVHVDADDDKAHVRVFGVTIDADDDNANVHTNWGAKSAMIKAGPHGAVVRTIDIRHGAADLLYILASDDPGPSGYHSVGYAARGPTSGPLVVGVFKTRADTGHDFHDHDVDALINLNVKH